MSIKRVVSITNSSMYLSNNVPIFVNRIEESFNLEQHSHEFLEINYVSEGSGFHYIEGNTIPVVKGDLFFLPVGVSHVFRPATPTPSRGHLVVYNCLFNEQFVRRMLQQLLVDDEISHLLLTPYPTQDWLQLRDRDDMFQQSFDLMLEEYQLQRPNFLLLLQVEVTRLLINMQRFQESSSTFLHERVKQQPQRQTDIAIDTIAKRVQAHCIDVASVQILATEVGVSERHFRRRFKERYHMSFIAYVHKCRIESSCKLLTRTTDKISTIAQIVGYKDIKFFNSLFKKITGTTPHKYRTSHQL